MSKPDWKSAPEWAQWLAQDEDGEWFWFEGQPTDKSCSWQDDANGKVRSAGLSEENETWAFTLEKRPADLDSAIMTEEEEQMTAEELPKSKYHREIAPGVWVDVYDVLHAWAVQNPALQHLIKKALQPGERGHKDKAQDMDEIVASALRARELEG